MKKYKGLSTRELLFIKDNEDFLHENQIASILGISEERVRRIRANEVFRKEAIESAESGIKDELRALESMLATYTGVMLESLIHRITTLKQKLSCI